MRKFVIVFKGAKNIRDNQFFDSETSAKAHALSWDDDDSNIEIKEIDIRFIEEGEL